ncbi:hypothetical protein RUM43_008933 [Polyplax serrata]|uniref:Uncharacterized protein n=1 Tax=Polyplax serrata TaxID=468196 RepID=A0AAN8NPC0_POLSC
MSLPRRDDPSTRGQPCDTIKIYTSEENPVNGSNGSNGSNVFCREKSHSSHIYRRKIQLKPGKRPTEGGGGGAAAADDDDDDDDDGSESPINSFRLILHRPNRSC